jgi:hypothetical protein
LVNSLLVALQRLELEQAVFVDVGIHIDGIDGDNGGQQRGAGGDKIARGRHRAADAAGDRRLDGAVLELDLSAVLGGLGGFQRRLRLKISRLLRVSPCSGAMAFFSRSSPTRLNSLSMARAFASARVDLGLGGAKFGLERALVDGEEEVSFF